MVTVVSAPAALTEALRTALVSRMEVAARVVAEGGGSEATKEKLVFAVSPVVQAMKRSPALSANVLPSTGVVLVVPVVFTPSCQKKLYPHAARDPSVQVTRLCPKPASND